MSLTLSFRNFPAGPGLHLCPVSCKIGERHGNPPMFQPRPGDCAGRGFLCGRRVSRRPNDTKRTEPKCPKDIPMCARHTARQKGFIIGFSTRQPLPPVPTARIPCSALRYGNPRPSAATICPAWATACMRKIPEPFCKAWSNGSPPGPRWSTLWASLPITAPTRSCIPMSVPSASPACPTRGRAATAILRSLWTPPSTPRTPAAPLSRRRTPAPACTGRSWPT